MIEVEQEWVEDCVRGLLCAPPERAHEIMHRVAAGIMVSMAREMPAVPQEEILEFGNRFRLAVAIRLGEIVGTFAGEHGHA